jgi:hypothetical protein
MPQFPPMPVPIICGDKVSKFSDYEDGIPVNMIAVSREIEGSAGYLFSHDGLTQIRTGQGVDRGAHYNERMRRMFRVSGEKLIEITAGGVVVIGDIPGVDLVTITYSFQSLLIVASGKAWRYDGVILSQLTDVDLGYPIDVTQIDGYYFFTDGEYLYHTDIDDETNINPLKFATSELSPDPTRAVGRTQDDLLQSILSIKARSSSPSQGLTKKLLMLALSALTVGARWMEMCSFWAGERRSA